jgi:hypothetical protein
MPRLTRLSIAVIATENALSLNSLRRYARMNKCAMCGRLVEGRYVCKSCEKNVKGNLNASSNPCHNCPTRTSKCHSYCKEYAEWLKEFATLAQEELQREVISKDASSKQDLSKETAETKANEIVEKEEMEAYDALDSMDSMDSM